ncbi:MAG: adenine deaminase [Bacteroidales bacterium]|nr:MAG: adenine deaminase [Bacteroidales bacterium]
MENKKTVEGVIFDPINRVIISGRFHVENGRIAKIENDEKVTQPIILPGFIDSHIHVESSMLTPKEFARIAKKHGTTAVIADPHEIANVAGVEGINFMIENSKGAGIRFFFGAPSCVPATSFDDCHTIIDSEEINKILQREDIYFLAEMMNFPGVINSDSEVLKKIIAAKLNNKVIDGHAPGLIGDNLTKYINSGISTDHECFSLEEAHEKIAKGMKVLIREGSAAKNFNALHSLISTHTKSTMVCTDDCHPEDLIVGHINQLVKRSLQQGYNIFDVLQVVSVNPIKHYNLKIGLLQQGDSADFIVVDNLEKLTVLANYISGKNVLENKESCSTAKKSIDLDYTFTSKFDIESIKISPKSNTHKAIQVIDGELLTNEVEYNIKTDNHFIVSDTENDFLKIVVVNRYKQNQVSVGFINGFGLKKGAIAESIAHDSHHIIAVGIDDDSINKAIEFIMKSKGGVCYFNGKSMVGLSLPIYGLMSDEPYDVVAEKYRYINSMVIEDGCLLKAPFMTLSFMALSVIPSLKITPKGLFDVNQFKFIDPFI